MVVYWEYAFLENAVLDGFLLLLALKCARMKVRALRLAAAACAGGAFAVAFPLMRLPVWAAYLVKFAFGGVLSLLAGSGMRAKRYVLLAVCFFAVTFLFGGALTALYAFFGIETADGTGFYLERVPVALLVGTFGLLGAGVIAGAKAFFRFRAVERNLIPCKLENGDKTLSCTGFYDSGNCLTFHGKPVCLISAAGVFALFGAHPSPVGRMRSN